MEGSPVQPGCLYLVPTPIGNLEDLSPRARRVLESVDLVAAEDTRRTATLLSACGITAKLISYREQNRRRAAEQVLGLLASGGTVALVSDAGTPALNDPGRDLVRLTVERGFTVFSLPGPSAVTAAVAASGLFRQHFLFLGFPPRQENTLRRWAEDLAGMSATLVFFESPIRLGRTLQILAEVLGERKAVVAREISKLHEQFDRGTLSQLAAKYAGGARGEITVVLEGTPRRANHPPAPPASWKELALALCRGERLSPAKISELLAAIGNFDRRSVYRWLLELQGKFNADSG